MPSWVAPTFFREGRVATTVLRFEWVVARRQGCNSNSGYESRPTMCVRNYILRDRTIFKPLPRSITAFSVGPVWRLAAMSSRAQEIEVGGQCVLNVAMLTKAPSRNSYSAVTELVPERRYIRMGQSHSVPR